MGNLQEIANEFPAEFSQLRTILEERDFSHGGINSDSVGYENTAGSSRSGMTKIKLSMPKAIHTEEEIKKTKEELEIERRGNY